MRLPNAGAIKWRKQDNSGDLGIALNASNHLAMDAIIDFAAGQTFGASTVPDATTLSKGIVQIDPVGGINVAAGVISLSASGVGPRHLYEAHRGRMGSRHSWYDDLGRRPARPHARGLRYRLRRAPFTIQDNGAAVGTRRALNLIQGASIGLTFLDVPSSDRVNVTIALGAHTHAQADVTSLTTDLAGKAAISHTHSEANITGLVADLAAKAAISHHARRGRHHRLGVGPRGQGCVLAHAHIVADHRRDRERNGWHAGPPRWLGRRQLRVRRRQQPVGVPGLASPVR